MIDINLIVNHTDKFLQAMQKRNIDFDVSEILELYKKRKEAMMKFEKLASEKNKLAKEVGALAQQGKTKEELSEYVVKGKKIADELAGLDGDMQMVQAELNKKLSMIPNMVLSDVPFGKDETAETPVRFCPDAVR